MCAVLPALVNTYHEGSSPGICSEPHKDLMQNDLQSENQALLHAQDSPAGTQEGEGCRGSRHARRAERGGITRGAARQVQHDTSKVQLRQDRQIKDSSYGKANIIFPRPFSRICFSSAFSTRFHLAHPPYTPCCQSRLLLCDWTWILVRFFRFSSLICPKFS